MQHDEFIGHVQQRARLGSRGHAEQVTRAVLETLGERLAGGAPGNLAAQLPPEIGRHLEEKEEQGAERLSLDDFFHRVGEKERADLPHAVQHARAVVSVLQDAVTQGEVEKVRTQLSDDFDPLFEAGSEGRMETR